MFLPYEPKAIWSITLSVKWRARIVEPAPTTVARSIPTVWNLISTSCAPFPSRKAASSQQKTTLVGRRVAILGIKVREQLFGKRTDVLGQEIAINSLPFRVIGLLADKNQNSSYGSPDENKIFIPYQTAARDIPPKNPSYSPGDLDDIIYKPHSLDDYEPARKQVVGILARRHHFDPRDTGALGIWDTVENAKEVDGIFQSMTVFLSIVALVTLSLGGVGVMNIMLVTVNERTAKSAFARPWARPAGAS